MLLNYGVGEDSLESYDCKESQLVHSKGDQPHVFFGRNDAKAETPVLWSPDSKSYSVEKTQILGKIEGQRGRGSRGGDG